VADHGTTQRPQIGFSARDQLYHDGKNRARLRKDNCRGYYIIYSHAETVVARSRLIVPSIFFLLTVDLATGAMNRLQAYMIMSAVASHEMLRKVSRKRKCARLREPTARPSRVPWSSVKLTARAVQLWTCPLSSAEYYVTRTLCGRSRSYESFASDFSKSKLVSGQLCMDAVRREVSMTNSG